MADDRTAFAPRLRVGSAESVETASLLPTLETDYKAHSTPENGDCGRLVLVMGKEGFAPGAAAYMALQYVHLGSGEFAFTATGQAFRFLVSDYQPKWLVVEGRNLLRVFDYVSLRRMPWIRVKDRDFRPVDDVSTEPVITAIRLEELTMSAGS